MASGRLVDYLQRGDAADRPVSLTLAPDSIGLFFAEDTQELSLWDGLAWVEDIGGGGGGSSVWGSITGTLSSQVDLQGALDAKLNAALVSVFGLSLINDADAATARVTLGLGTAATEDSTDFASSAQGALADSAVQSVVAGTKVSVNNTDPTNPIINVTAGDVSGPASSVADRIVLFDGTTGKLLKDGGLTIPALRKQSIIIACGDESTAITAGTAKVTFRMPYAFTLTEVRASLKTAQSAGSIFTVDVNEGGVSILSTKLTIDNTEKTSTTAATPPVISDASLADDAEITVDVDQIGTSGAVGLKVMLIGYPT